MDPDYKIITGSDLTALAAAVNTAIESRAYVPVGPPSISTGPGGWVYMQAVAKPAIVDKPDPE